MLKNNLIALLILFIALPFNSKALSATITELRASSDGSTTRIVLNVENKPNYEVFMLNNPNRLVVDLKEGVWRIKNQSNKALSTLESIRVSDDKNGDLRIVFDLKKDSIISDNFLLSPNNKNNYRMVIDLNHIHKNSFDSISSIIESNKVLSKKNVEIKPTNNFITPSLKPKKPIIVIDAGHGGKDPGAIGRKKTFEKDVTLSYATELKKQLLRTGNFEVYMTRNNDKFIPLRQRVKKAEEVGGNLFISIHADSAHNKKARGLSVYTLSEIASDKEAAALARKENQSGIIGNIDIEKSNDEINELLIDLVQRDTKNISASFAETIIKNMKEDFKTVRNPHRFAGFRVLTGAKVPSVLLELGYLSNKREEKLLKKRSYKKKLINNLVEAIEEHFNKHRNKI